MNSVIEPATIAAPAAKYALAVAIPAGSEIVLTSGIVGERPDGTISTDVAEQAAEMWRSIDAILDAGGFTKTDVVAYTTYAVVGHGMNARELAANPRLDRWFVQDLNRNPLLPLDDGAFDAELCCAGVEYLQRPIEVLADVRRVIRKGAPLVVSFSNRYFPTKAVAVWRALDAEGHARKMSGTALLASRLGARVDVAGLAAPGHRRRD